MSFTPFSLIDTHSHQSVPSYSYYGRPACNIRQGGLKHSNPGSRPLFRGTKTCYRPFTQLKKLNFRDRLLKAPALPWSEDQWMPECEGLMEPRRILFGSSAFRIKLLKSFQEEIFLIKLNRKHCFMLSAWLLMNLPPVADRFASQYSTVGGRTGSLHRAKLRAAFYLSLGKIKNRPSVNSSQAVS